MNPEFSLLVDLYELTMAQCYFYYRKDTRATFDLFVRNLPRNRSYLVAAGLNDLLHYLQNIRFTNRNIAYLKSQKLFRPQFLNYLKDFKFHGDIWAMPEGTVFFANEPILRVTAPIIEAQIIESFFLNTVNLQTMIASKAARVVLAARGKSVFDFALRRTHGQDAAVKVARSAYLSGFSGTSNVLAGKKYGIPISGTMAHSFVMSFNDEPRSFSVYSRIFPERTILLVDTYDTKVGIDNAVKVGLDLKNRGHRLLGIRLDSGDIVQLSKLARRRFNAAGLGYVKIFASGNLDEFKIDKLIKKKAAVDSFGVGTHMGVSEDAPSLDVIYKLSEVSHDGQNFLPTMKLSRGKITYPGRKQVFRIKNKKGRFVRDILAIENEKFSGKPLLKSIVRRGRIIYRSPGIKKIRQYAASQLSEMPESLRKIYSPDKFKVIISEKLKRLTKRLSSDLHIRQ